MLQTCAIDLRQHLSLELICRCKSSVGKYGLYMGGMIMMGVREGVSVRNQKIIQYPGLGKDYFVSSLVSSLFT